MDTRPLKIILKIINIIGSQDLHNDIIDRNIIPNISIINSIVISLCLRRIYTIFLETCDYLIYTMYTTP